MAHDIERRGRRHGDLLRAWRPRDRSEIQRVERIYDASGRLRGERATRERYSIAELDPRVIGQLYPMWVGLLVTTMPFAVVVSIFAAGGAGGWVAAVLATVVWAAVIGVEGVIFCVALGACYVSVGLVVGAAFGDRGGWIGGAIFAVLVGALTWRDVR